MKTKFYVLLASAALSAQAQAGGYHGGGGMGGHFAVGPAPARAGAVPSFHSTTIRSFGGYRMTYPNQRFSPISQRLPSSLAFRQYYINSNKGAALGAGQSARGRIIRDDHHAQIPSEGNRAITNQRRGVNGAGQARHGNSLPSNWRNHVVARQSADWHRDWDRSRDHLWNGHHCRFINGSWVVFDFGFYPWWPDAYPYDYYAYGYPYTYDYDSSYYDGAYQGEQYYDQNGYADQYTDSTVAAAQESLARQGYYRGEIDGVLGAETRRAIARYQSGHGLRVTGQLTNDTLQALGLRGAASVTTE